MALKRALSENALALSAAAEQRILEEQHFWFPLPNIQVWGIKVH